MHHCHKIRLWSSVSSTRRQRSSGSMMWAPELGAGGGDAAARGGDAGARARSHRRGRWSAGPATRALELGAGSSVAAARGRHVPVHGGVFAGAVLLASQGGVG